MNVFARVQGWSVYQGCQPVKLKIELSYYLSKPTSFIS